MVISVLARDKRRGDARWRGLEEEDEQEGLSALDPSLRTDRLILRRWRRDDLEPFARINADPKVMEHFPSRLNREESDGLVARLHEHFAQHGFGFWAVEVIGDAPFIGFVGLKRPDFEAHFMPCVEVGWRIDSRFWNRGLATEAARAAVQFGFTEVGLREIVSFTTPDNLASRRVMEKLGMRHSPDENFEHPGLPAGHRLRLHVLYRLRR